MRRSSLAGELFSWKQRVHRAGAESLEVQGHELETESFENANEFCCHLGAERARQFVVGDFDADDFAMVTHSELLESERANRVLALLDRGESLTRDRAPVLDTRRQTSRSRLVPNPQVGVVR